jgi:hypothetical protein
LSALLNFGCFTFVGVTVGASVDRLTELPPRTYPAPAQCRDVRLVFHDKDGTAYRVDAELIRADPQMAELRLADGRSLAVSWKSVTSVSCPNGTHVLTGFALGAATDAVLLALLMAQLSGAYSGIGHD